LAINAKGENLLAQSKRTTPPLILKFSKTTISQKRKKLFQHVSVSQKEEIISIAKTLLTTKGRTSSGGAFI
jgi:hypothetical protein